MKRTETIRAILAETLNTPYDHECIDKIINEYQTIPMLMSASSDEIAKLIGRSKARKMKNVMEFAMGIYGAEYREAFKITAPQKVYELMRLEMEFANVEKFVVLGLSMKNQVMIKEYISIGTLNSTFAEPRDIYHSLIRRGGIACCIVAHNHPSGDPTPSREDEENHIRTVAAGEVLGIPCIDHIIIGHSKFYSFKNKELYKV